MWMIDEHTAQCIKRERFLVGALRKRGNAFIREMPDYSGLPRGTSPVLLQVLNTHRGGQTELHHRSPRRMGPIPQRGGLSLGNLLGHPLQVQSPIQI